VSGQKRWIPGITYRKDGAVVVNLVAVLNGLPPEGEEDGPATAPELKPRIEGALAKAVSSPRRDQLR
jgi:hypothetical protein